MVFNPKEFQKFLEQTGLSDLSIHPGSLVEQVSQQTSLGVDKICVIAYNEHGEISARTEGRAILGSILQDDDIMVITGGDLQHAELFAMVEAFEIGVKNLLKYG